MPNAGRIEGLSGKGETHLPQGAFENTPSTGKSQQKHYIPAGSFTPDKYALSQTLKHRLSKN